MNVRHIVLAIVVGLASTVTLLGHAAGPDPGVDGVFGASVNCTLSGCHTTFPVNSGTGSVTITGLPSSWVPGQTYPLTVTVTGTGAVVYGFQLSAVADSTNLQAGTLSRVNGAVQIICAASAGTLYPGINCSAPGAIQFAEHTAATAVKTFSVNWIAPSSASVGTVRFNVAGNAANGDGTSLNDHIYTQTYKVATVDLSVKAFTMVDRGGVSVVTDGSGNLTAGYARILASSGSTPSGVAIFGERANNVLVTEAGVPASAPLRNGRIYAEVGPNGSGGLGTDIGLAIANPSTQAATISFSYTNSSGTDVGSGTTTVGAGQQSASFLDQAPWNVPVNFQGTFTFSSNVAISVIALQLNNNQRGEALITTLPVIDTSVAPGNTPAVLSHFTNGAGWNTAVLLVNPTDVAMNGTIQFRDQTGAIVPLSANGQNSNSFSYAIARRSSFKLQTVGGTSLQVGSVTVTPSAGSNTPVSLAVFSYTNSGTTITQAGVPSLLGTAFRMWVEATPGYGTVGSYSTGFAIANASSTAGAVTFTLFNGSGAPANLTFTKQLPAFGQFSGFLADIFPSLTFPFQGVLEVTTTSPSISAVAERIRFNERGEFLVTTTPPTNENSSTTSAEFDFPHIVNGGGFTTEFILFSGQSGLTSSGNLKFVKQDGSDFSLTVN